MHHGGMSFEHPAWLLHLPDESTGEPYRWRWVALGFISLAIMLIGVDISVTGVAAPALSSELGATNADIQWVFDAFTLAVAGFVLLGGGLADRFGRKGTFQSGMALFAVGSAVAAFAASPSQLIVGRAITGLGAALVMPPALSMLSVIFPPGERPRAIAIWSTIAAIGIALGPVIGGVLLEHYWFGAIFLINVPVTIVAIVGAAFAVPTSRGPGHSHLDVVGAVLSVVGLTGLVGGTIEAPARGWTDPVVVSAFVVGALGTAAFIRWELSRPEPLLDLRVFRVPRVVAGALSLMIVFITFSGAQELLIPQYLQYVEGDSTIETGLMMLPVGIVFGGASFIGPRVVARYGARLVVLGGLSAMVVGMSLYGLLAWWGGDANVLVATFVFSAGIGFVVAPSTTTIMNALPTSKAGDGSAVNQISRQIGGAMGAAIGGSIYAGLYRSGLLATAPALPPAQQQAATSSVSGALDVADRLPATAATALDDAARRAATVSMSAAFFVAALLTLVVLVVAWALLRDGSRPAPTDDGIPEAEVAPTR